MFLLRKSKSKKTSRVDTAVGKQADVSAFWLGSSFFNIEANKCSEELGGRTSSVWNETNTSPRWKIAPGRQPRQPHGGLLKILIPYSVV